MGIGMCRFVAASNISTVLHDLRASKHSMTLKHYSQGTRDHIWVRYITYQVSSKRCYVYSQLQNASFTANARTSHDGAVRRHAMSQATLTLNHATLHDPQPPGHVSWVHRARHKRYWQLWAAPNRPGDHPPTTARRAARVRRGRRRCRRCVDWYDLFVQFYAHQRVYLNEYARNKVLIMVCSHHARAQASLDDRVACMHAGNARGAHGSSLCRT